MGEVIAVIFFVYALSSILYWSLKLGISPMFSSYSCMKSINTLVQSSTKNKVVDLGSGWGFLAIYLARKNPTKEIVGYELSTLPFYFSRLLLLCFGLDNCRFVKKNYLDQDLNGILAVTYLFPKGMDLLEQKLQKQRGSLSLISSTFAFKKLQPYRTYYVDDLHKTPIYYYKL